MIALALILLQSASAPSQPDISIRAVVDARSARVQSQGNARAKAASEPDGGSRVESSGSRQSAHWELQIDARIADPMRGKSGETSQPPQR